MTKAQEVKKALKGHFQNLKSVNGKGTAWGWVHLSFDYKKPEECYCNRTQGMYCSKCRDAHQEATKKVYELIKQSKTELYSYCSDDGYNTDRDCMLIDVNLI
jgi:adenine deaminase